MKAFVLAGGEGTRLKPYTYSVPKPMLLLAGKPILEYVFSNLKRCGITEVIVTVGYQHEQIEGYFGDGSKIGMKIEYCVEKERMNTAGSITTKKINETFAVVMGDHITNINLKDMLDHHQKSKAIATIALYKDILPLEYGVAQVNNGNIIGFKEKPLLEHLYNTAIYIFEKEIYDYINDKEDFAKDVIPRLISQNKKINSYIFDDVWFDIGRVSDYEKLAELLKVIKVVNDLKV